jgi:hypothetical protein
MLFHPRAEAPSEPSAGLVRYEPGSQHDFAHFWYILERSVARGPLVGAVKG